MIYIIGYSYINNGKKKGAINQYLLILNTLNSNIRTKSIDNKKYDKKIIIKSKRKNNIKDNFIKQVSPYNKFIKLHYIYN